MTVVSGLERARGSWQGTLSVMAKSDLLTRLDAKLEQAETGLNEALNVTLEATLISRVGRDGEAVKEVPKKEADAMTTVSPGQEFLVAVDFHNGSKDRLFIDGLKLEVPKGMEHDFRQDETCRHQARRERSRSFSVAGAEGRRVHATVLASRRSGDGERESH